MQQKTNKKKKICFYCQRNIVLPSNIVYIVTLVSKHSRIYFVIKFVSLRINIKALNGTKDTFLLSKKSCHVTTQCTHQELCNCHESILKF